MADFHAGPLSWSNWIWRVGFCGGKKAGEPGEKPSEQGENQQQTQRTYGTGLESNRGHIGGRRVLSPLRYPCSLIRNPIRKLVQLQSSRKRW